MAPSSSTPTPAGTSAGTTAGSPAGTTEAPELPAWQVGYGHLHSLPSPAPSCGGGCGWTRPPDWLPLPPIAAGEQKLVGLFPVFPGDISVLALQASGSYTIDWGDGSSESISSPAQVTHQQTTWFANNFYGPLERVVLAYLFEPRWQQRVEGTLVVEQNHQQLPPEAYRLEVNAVLNSIDIVLTNPVIAEEEAVNIQAHWDWLETTIEPIRPEHRYSYEALPASSQCSRGYRQVLVTLTAQSGGAITALDLSPRHSSIGVSHASCPWLELAISLTQAESGASLQLCGYASRGSDDVLASLERLVIHHCGGATQLGALLRNATALQQVSIEAAPQLQSAEGMFEGCSALREVSISGAPQLQNLDRLFQGCSALLSAPAIDTATATTMAAMFQGCRALRQLPPYDTAMVTSMGAIFRGCCSLLTIPPLNTAAVISMASAFAGCSALMVLPPLQLGNVEDMGDALAGCAVLTAAPLQGISTSFSVWGCNLSRAALVQLLEGLPVVEGNPVLDIGQNWGLSELSPDDLLIASSKGWSLTY